MLFWRFLIAGTWMLPFVLKKHAAEKVLHMDKRILIAMFILGAIGYAGSSGFYFIATRYTGTGLSMVIFFSYPIVIALFSWIIHRKKLNKGIIFTLILMTTGLFLLQNSSERLFSLVGIFFAVAASVCYAFYIIGSKRYSSISIDSNTLSMVVCYGCAFLFLILAIATHTLNFPPTLKSWLYLIALGILVTALPIQLMLEGLKHVSSMRASIISVLEPLVTVFVGLLLLNESISGLQTIGVAIILGSAIMVQFQKEL